MKVDAGRGKLYSALKTVRHQWDAFEESWQDPMRQDFEEQIWEPLNRMSVDTLQAIDQLAQIFAEMRHECEGRGRDE
ncbi:hypothetical protein [Tuwongella immobilis]|uniref:Uncharacterized protein n=1 Tax=Tuwongella immobilis TaxID=692036 RepID=A0A6C2YH33_9BACT|nr:hypothetical protein [Tuwongella immobilis]VIP00664.1 unnamed protein product [Tuwongella immobilis]VTR96746.1 unnamed protein product [Tuwongella immobilis]